MIIKPARKFYAMCKKLTSSGPTFNKNKCVNTLFPVTPTLPNGFRYVANFLSAEEEQQLLGAIADVELHPLIFQGYEAKRKVKSFGYDYNFSTRQITEGAPIPSAFSFFVEKVAAFTNIPANLLAEMLVTEYPEGSVINWHRDAPPFETIIGISLLSDCNFRFRPYASQGRKRADILSLPVERRSLYIIDGEARSDWEHSIPAVAKKRYSITFRTLK